MNPLPTFKIKTQPTEEPFTQDDLQGQLNADQTDDGSKAERVLTTARELVESHSGVSLMPTVWWAFLDKFPQGVDCEDAIRLMRGPVTAIGSLVYVDTAGDSTTLSGSLYQTDIKRTPARIRPAFGLAWPTARSSTLNAITIEFTAGFASKALVPKKATQAALMLAAYWTENPSMMGQVGADISMAYWALVDALHWEVFDE